MRKKLAKEDNKAKAKNGSVDKHRKTGNQKANTVLIDKLLE
jgi:hypothetical protein